MTTNWLAALLFVLPIYLPIIHQCTATYYVGTDAAARCPVINAPQPCTEICDGVHCWPTCYQYPGAEHSQ
jgi:hypothetical protein